MSATQLNGPLIPSITANFRVIWNTNKEDDDVDERWRRNSIELTNDLMAKGIACAYVEWEFIFKAYHACVWPFYTYLIVSTMD